MTKEMHDKLRAAGLNGSQINSKTADQVIQILMNDGEKALIREAENYVFEMREELGKIRRDYQKTQDKIGEMSETFYGVVEAEKEHGSVTEDRAKNVIALYGQLINMAIKAGASPGDAVSNAGYVLYAYLGGQAKREVTYVNGGNDR